MKSLLCFAAIAALAASGEALAVGSLAEVTIVDRDSGVTLTPYYHRGEYWVAGTPGARYGIEIHNRSAGRLLAVTSVDGVNVLSGATAGWSQTGYVFDPGERYEITGWRKSDAQVAAFTFTAAPNSYAERTGRAHNVGVIGVAVFRERPPAVAYSAPVAAEAAEAAADSRNAPRQQAAQTASGARQGGLQGGNNAGAPLAKLGTGFGGREQSFVTHTEFQRLQDEPNEVIRIRYDSLENLVAMGIVRHPRPAVPGVNPFPASPNAQYVPDPPG